MFFAQSNTLLVWGESRTIEPQELPCKWPISPQNPDFIFNTHLSLNPWVFRFCSRNFTSKSKHLSEISWVLKILPKKFYFKTQTMEGGLLKNSLLAHFHSLSEPTGLVWTKFTVHLTISHLSWNLPWLVTQGHTNHMDWSINESRPT